MHSVTNGVNAKGLYFEEVHTILSTVFSEGIPPYSHQQERHIEQEKRTKEIKVEERKHH